MIKLIGRQVSIDIFFIDWEKPRARSVIQPPSEGKQNNGAALNEKQDGSVSIWRTYFVANEWNEIQAIRKIHFGLQVIITLFFLEVSTLHRIPH
jgi:meckelin